jgi:hypothetical protein
LGRFSNAAKRFGIETTEIARGPLGVGCRLQMSAGDRHYEVAIDGNGQMTLGRVEADGKRVRLCAGSTNIESGWNRMLGALKNAEGRMAA